jgi:hypothetical protein
MTRRIAASAQCRPPSQVPEDCAITHHIDAHRQVRGLRRDVDDALAAALAHP